MITGCSESGPTIKEENRTLKTYPFSEPNPIPILSKDKRLYPYHSFVGYSHEGSPQEWKMIKMENDHIEVYVLPEVGGKVWGAIDKSNGEEFIYRNEVMKFRNISLRGPWTSGGIEFNFGVIGHTPATATPVDYITRTNPNGSVSTFVGGMDLPSRTHWRVEIILEKGRSNFQTKAMWYNPTPSVQAYYNWMTAAAFAQDDLEMVFPGNQYLKHSGEVKSWPIDNEGRNLTFYDNNRFEGHKSYHVVGEWKNFFGGYYHNDGYGFGHWANHDAMPGQKLWLWALSREGGVWEDLLTDTDGQYVEFQAGRQWVQYSPGNHQNPVRKAGFDAYGTDRWEESWFPVKGTEGMKEASNQGVMNVKVEDGEVDIKLHSFIGQMGTLKVVSGSEIIMSQSVKFEPMILHSFTIEKPKGDFDVIIEALDLHYRSNPDPIRFDRSFKMNETVLAAVPDAERKYLEGYELLKERRYAEAEELFQKVLSKNPHHLNTNKGMADLFFRQGLYLEGLKAIRKNLAVNGYDAEANFSAGNLYRALGKYNDAREAFGWAARSLAYRSAAFTQMAEIYLIEKKWDLAIDYGIQALDFNRFNMNAMQVLVLANRKLGNTRLVKEWVGKLLAIDPIHHFANLESYFLNPTQSNWDKYKSMIQNEFPDQIHLESAISYINRGFLEEAVDLLVKTRSNNPLVKLWVAYLKNDPAVLSQVSELPSDFVFPYRRESIDALKWAVGSNDHWKLNYYLALNYWAKDRDKEALTLMTKLGNKPDLGAFYVSRSSLKEKLGIPGSENDLGQSILLSPDNWPILLHSVQYFQNNNNWDKAYTLSIKAFNRFPNNFNVEVMHAKSLLYTDRIDECISVLEKTQVIPSEMARESHKLFEWALIRKSINLIQSGKDSLAIAAIKGSKEWPENLGIGKPYDPDERLQNILLDYIKDETQKNEYIESLKNLEKEKIGKGYQSILIDAALTVIK